MSKIKAKEKALRKKASRIERERDLKEKIDSDKRALFLKEQEDKIRNAHAAERRELQNERTKFAESTAYRFANKHQNAVLDSVVAKIGGNSQLAYDFIIEELEAASLGNSIAKQFAKKSGITEKEFKGALSRALIEVESGPQLTIIKESNLIRERYGIDFAISTRLAVLEKIMQLYGFGKYSKGNATSQACFESPDLKSDDQELRSLFEEYFQYCKNPKRFSTTYLTKMILQVCQKIKSPSKILKDHLLLMRMISFAGDKVRSAHLPEDLEIFTDIKILSLLDLNCWIDILSKFKDHTQDEELIRAIGLGRQIGQPKDECIINFAPAIYNTLNLIYSEYPESKYKESIRSIMWDSSFVVGSIYGDADHIELFKIWAASI